MSQFANMELVENLKPFISRVVSDINVSVVSTYDAVANPNVVLQSNTGGNLVLSSLDIFSSLNFLSNGTIGGSGNLTITSPGGITINPTGDLTLQSGGDLWIYNDINFGHASPSISGNTIAIYANSGNIQLNGDEITAVGEFVVSGGSAEITFGLTVGSLGGVDDYPTRGQIIISNSVGAAIYDVLNIRDSRFSDGVAHGMNTNDTIFQVRSPSAGTSGTAMRFYSEGPTAVWFQGDAGDVTTDWAPIVLQSHFDNTTIPDANNLVAIANASIKKAQIYGNGSYSTTGGASLGLLTLPVQGQLLLRKANGANTHQLRFSDAAYTHGTAQGMNSDSSYFEIGPASPANGGPLFRGSSSNNYGLWFLGSVPLVNDGNLNGDARAPIMFEGRINNGAFTSDANNLAVFRANGIGKVLIKANGEIQSTAHGLFQGGLKIGSGSEPYASEGLVISKSANGSDSLTLASNAVNTGFTDVDPNIYYNIGTPIYGAGGGVNAQAVSNSVITFSMTSKCGAENTLNGTGGGAPFRYSAYINNGSGGSVGLPTVTANIFTIRNGTLAQFNLKANGNLYLNGSVLNFAHEDDLALCAAFDWGISPIKSEFDSYLRRNREKLVEHRIISDDGFINVTMLQALHNGAILQLGARIAELENVSITAMIKLILNKWLRKVVR